MMFCRYRGKTEALGFGLWAFAFLAVILAKAGIALAPALAPTLAFGIDSDRIYRVTPKRKQMQSDPRLREDDEQEQG